MKVHQRVKVLLLLFAVTLVLPTGFAVGKELTILSWMGGQNKPVYERYIAEFEAEHGVTVHLVHASTGDFWDKLDTMTLAGMAPDIFFMSSEHLAKYHKLGVLEPLDEWAKDSPVDVDDFFPPSTEQYRIGGQLYALPYDFGNRVIIYNVDAFNEAGMMEPTKDWSSSEWTFDDMRAAAQRLKKTESDGSVTRWGMLYPNSYRGWSPFIYSYGARFTKVTETGYETGLDGPEAIAAFAFLQEMWRDADWGKHGSYTDVPGGTAVMSQFIPGQVTAMQNQHTGFNWDIAPWPRGPGGRLTSGGGTGWALSAQSDNPELAWKLYEMITSKELQLDIMLAGSKAPGRQSVAFHPEFLQQSPPESMQVFIDAWFNIANDPSVPTWTEYMPAVRAAYLELTRLEITPQELAERMRTQGNAILQAD